MALVRHFYIIGLLSSQWLKPLHSTIGYEAFSETKLRKFNSLSLKECVRDTKRPITGNYRSPLASMAETLTTLLNFARNPLHSLTFLSNHSSFPLTFTGPSMLSEASPNIFHLPHHLPSWTAYSVNLLAFLIPCECLFLKK